MKGMAAAVISLGVLASAPRGSLAASANEFLWEGPVAAGKTLDLRGLNGPIHAVRAAGGTATVRAIRRSDHKDVDPASVRIEQYVDGNTLYFCAVYPGQRAGSPNPCRPLKQKHTWGDDDHADEITVDWEVKVPAGVKLAATTVNGDLELEDLASSVEATTVNGSISLGTREFAEATTVNGTIHARLGARKLPHDLSFKTVNGSVVLTLADGIGAEVRAEALNGAFESDFPVTVSGSMRPNKVRGTINGGGALLSMTTVNGSLELRRYRSASK